MKYMTNFGMFGANIIYTMEYYKMKISQLLLSSRTQI